MWLAVLILSGRRQGDLKNIQSGGVTTRGDSSYVLLPKDKMSQNNLVAFNFRWIWTLRVDLEPIKNEFLRLVEKEEKPFEMINIQKVRRLSDFRLHAIRNRRAIELAIEGHSEEQIMSYIGWASKSSLLRYTQVPTAVLATFNGYCEALEFINK